MSAADVCSCLCFVSCIDVRVQLRTDGECYGFGRVVDLVAVGIELGKEVERRTQDGGEEKCDLGGEESHCKRDRSCCAQSLFTISSSIFYIRTGVNFQRRRMFIPKQSWLLVGECDADCDTEFNTYTLSSSVCMRKAVVARLGKTGARRSRETAGRVVRSGIQCIGLVLKASTAATNARASGIEGINSCNERRAIKARDMSRSSLRKILEG